MNELLFNQIALADFQKVNELYLKGYCETTDFNEAVLSLINSLSAYHQESSNESRTQGEHLQETELAKGA